MATVGEPVTPELIPIGTRSLIGRFTPETITYARRRSPRRNDTSNVLRGIRNYIHWCFKSYASWGAAAKDSWDELPWPENPNPTATMLRYGMEYLSHNSAPRGLNAAFPGMPDYEAVVTNLAANAGVITCDYSTTGTDTPFGVLFILAPTYLELGNLRYQVLPDKPVNATGGPVHITTRSRGVFYFTALPFDNKARWGYRSADQLVQID